MQREEIIFPLDKKKLYLSLFGSIVFVIIGIWILLKQPSSSHIIFGNPIIRNIAGVASILFFSIIGFSILKKIPDNKPGLIINAIGITDNSSGVAAGLIKWSDITGMSSTTIANQRFAIISVKNPEEYIDRQNGIKRRTMKINYRSYGYPICISVNSLKANFKELFHTMLEEYTENTRNVS